jgi:hypothetical protein
VAILKHRALRSPLVLRLCCFLAAAAWSANITAQPRSETELKALFFITLARYTQWPQAAFPRETEPLVIGVVGPNPFGTKLSAMAENERAQGRALKVVSFTTADDFDTCHMLFFGEMSPTLRALVLGRLDNRPILTVSDTQGFASAGGMVELFLNHESKIRLKVSKRTVEGAGLNFAPSLWNLAEIVALREFFPITIFESSTWMSSALAAQSGPGGEPLRLWD